MTTGPDGKTVIVEQRIAEITARYGPGHTVTRVITMSAPSLTAAVSRVTRKLTSMEAVDSCA
jgi:hypothetical protein